jgi:hypothetical protein
MGTGWKYYKKGKSRPKKSATDKRRRERVQRKRLTGLGVPEEKVKKLNAKAVRLMLKRPAKLKKSPKA